MKILFTCFFISSLFVSAFAVGDVQWDNFQDGTTQGWGSGSSNPNPPVVITDGGPEGAGDAFLNVTSNGVSGPGGRLINLNAAQWTGDFISAGLTVISMYMKNFGEQDLSMRIAIRGSGGSFWSSNAEVIPAHSGWQVAQFSLLSGDLTGGSNINATLGNVTEFRILHSVGGADIGDITSASLGIDDITAAEFPLPVELVSFNAKQNGGTVALNWTTATETNNRGFEIQRKLYRNGNENEWQLLGFKEGSGTSTLEKSYTYYDDLKNLNTDKIAYRLKQIDFNGAFNYSEVVLVEKVVPFDFNLSQNFPNPFNPSTKIKFNIPSDEFVSLKIFNVPGNEVAVLINEKKPAGSYEVNFEASHLPSGTYYYQLIAGNYTQTKKMILIK